MSSSSKVPSTETGNYSHKNTFYVDGKISNCSGTHLEHEAEEDDVDEEEDVDFNPFLKGSPSLEASSSLSSDIEVLDSCQMQDYNTGGAELGEEIVMQAAISSTGACEKETEITPTERVEMIPENEKFYKENMDMDDEDAVCKRTRARYSLASFTLDELETFLQETDDDDDLYNVDDEEEYRKFLAAVLQGGGDNSQIRQDNENMEDEDEENDADFEIELEEALESDLEENCRGGTQEEHGAGRRPETRLNRRQKASVKQKNRHLGQASRPLRPLLPNTPVASFPVLIPETAPQGLSISGHHGFVYGFTPQQLGQLHCLIHEHVQLLVQVFSLCVLDPSRQHIASQVKDLISETLQKRDQVTSWRRVPYPCFFFCPPGTHPSVQHKHTKSLTAACTFGSDCSFDEQRESFPGANEEKCGYATSGQVGCFQTSDSSLWVPFVDAPIVSVLDVAPLNLVGKFMDEVSIAVREYQRQRIQSACDTQLKKEPLFPFHSSQSFTEVDTEVSRGPTPPTDQPPKKTLAAALVERTKKQSIALVPKEISELAQRFLPLFNPTLFPHKPPPGPVANRVLFTDAEDELLAMGLMEYNTDWKAIQQRFLPCKSKHQIFIRQKNRSSSKAPENPIKAVRRMKSSPLTEEEIARIQEGLKVFKLDWMSVWKFVVPYRDPSLLPRQWRIASGTQKSYKSSADKKERRRLYELNRRKCRPAALASWQTSSEKEECQTDNVGGENNSGDDCMGNEDGAFVHEAFLADWRPVTSSVSLSLPLSNLLERRTSGLLPQDGSHVIQQTNGRFYESSTEPNQSVADTTLRHCKPQLCSRPYLSRRTNSARLVKLAPDLPPVNLPPSVRIMSQSAFRGYEDGKGKIVLPGQDANPGSSHLLKINEKVKNPFERSNVNQHHRESCVFRDKCVSGDNDQLDLRMHPLLFQSLGDGQLPYYPLSCAGSISSSSFGFLSQFQPQLNLSLLCNPHQANQTANRKETASAVGIDFHPLLQKADDVTSNSVTGHGLAQLPVNSESLRSSSALLQSQCGVVHAESRFENSLFGVSTLSSSPTEKANEIDLDIHLSFTSRIEKAARSRDVSQHSRKASNLSTPGSGTTTETQAPKRSRHAPCEYSPSPSASVQNRICNNLDSGVDSMAISSDSISVYGINVGDQSHPGIVMEQEELSDSEEEIGEHVEFECEEMDDSEADGGSDCEQIMDLQNKEVSSITREVEVTAEGKETRSNRLCLSLNFGPQSCLPHNELESASLETTGIKRSAGENCPPSHPRRSRKKPPCVGKHFVDRVQHQEEKRPESDSCAIYTSKVPRKSVRRTSTSGSNTGRLRKLDSNLNTDVSGENSTNDVLR